MKFKYLIIFYLFFSCTKEEAPKSVFLNKIDFIKTLGGSNNEAGKSIVKTVDDGYAIAGFAQSNDEDIREKTNTSFDFFITKFSAEDELQWSKIYGGTQDDRANKIVATLDGGFAVLGYTKSTDGNIKQSFGDRDLWLTKLDANGNLLWEKTFGFVGRDIGTTLIETSDNGFLILGELDVTSSNGQGKFRNASKHAGGDYWAIKLNQNGTKEWSKYYGGNFTDTPQSVVQTNTGDFIIAGTSDSSDVDITNNKGTYDFWIVKIASDGKLIWEKNFGGKEIDEARGVITTEDGNFIIVGDTRSADQDVSTNNGGADIWIIKIDINGNLLWEKTYGGSSFDVARSINKTFDGGYIIAGSSRSADNGFTNQGQNDALVFKINANGNLLWKKLVGGSEIDFFYDAIEVKKNNFIAVGESTSKDFDIKENKGFSDLLIVKIK